MGHVFSKNGTDRQKCTLERKNVQRIFFVTLLLAALSCTGVIVLHKDNTFALPEKSFVAVTLYAVGSVAFSCFAFHLLKRKSKKSELWLFQMLYMIANTGFLTYISYSLWKSTGSFLMYALVVLLNSCVLLYNKGEYALCAGIECLMPVALLCEKALAPHHAVVFAAVHMIAGVVAYEVQKGHRQAEEYRRKYIQEVKAAEMDPLTKITNRRGMMRRIMSVWPALEEVNRAVAVMVIDVDHFKKYNDCFGHPAGDACLCRVADIVRRTIKGEHAFVSRIGGEEFLVFVHGLGEQDAYALAEQIRHNVEAAGMPHAEDAKYRNVTVSIGVATDRCSGEISFGGMYRRADKELYRAKNSGRNRVGFRRSDFSTYSERRVSGR
ncbi:MAG: diguanylate cyclase [Lachnospiraceae bacterium]|nr:diguanylate cyclase [Lachnospiraceae bacterium]